MPKRAIGLFFAIAFLGGCKSKANTPENSSTGKSAAAQSSASSQTSDPPTASLAPQFSDPPAVSSVVQYSDPPAVNVGLGVEQAYAAIPHRRTIWVESESSVPPEEKAYLKVMFQVLDQGVAVRVAGLQDFSSQKFDSTNVDVEFDRLITFVRAMPVPKTLVSYHNNILEGLSGQRQFFAEWKSQGDRFEFARQISNHPGVRSASSALRTAYGTLMSKYPNENQTNKDAFFDYHCALDFI